MNTIKGNIVLFFTLAIFSNEINAQVTMPVFGKQELLNGYTKALSGETIPYFSVYPDYAKEALLTRCTDGKKSIEWETASIPAGYKNKYLYFSWIAAHSTGTNSGIRHFDLYINDQYVLTFITYPKNYPAYWSFAGKDSTQLVFQLKTKDGAMDAHGFAYLRVPAAKYEKGKPLRIRVTGENENSTDWYMTFKYSFEEKIDVDAPPFLLRGKAEEQQPLLFTVLHFGGPQKLNIEINHRPQKPFTVVNGINSFELAVDAVSKDTTLRIHAAIGELLTVDKEVVLQPVIKREIYLIHNSHNDIGYSNIQEDVAKIQNKNIRDALYLIKKTKSYPEGSRFLWNVESLWAVENFLGEATKEEKTDFINAVKNNQIGLGALYANILTGLSTPEEMNWIVQYATILREKYHVPINTAMMTDIPGLSWSMVHALASNGIRYFSNGPNYVEGLPDKGDRIGYTLKALGDKPFWWKSSSGKDSILFWTAGKGYSSWHGFAPGTVKVRGPKKIAAYLNELDKKNYPYSIVQWRYNIVSDNGPVDSTISDFVRAWNEKYKSPKLILANVGDVFAAFEKKYGNTIPTLSGDFTPYWEDGAYSTAREEGDNRVLSEKIIQLEDAARQMHRTIDSTILYRAKRDIVMFHEHTWGSYNSISDPDNPFTVHQWKYKKGFVDSAKFYVDEIASNLFPAVSNPSSISVINTLPWERAGFVKTAWPPALQGNALIDDKGDKIPVQKLADGNLGFITGNMPSNAEMKYTFTKGTTDSSAFRSPFNYTVDTTTGCISQLNTLNKQWVDSASAFKGIPQIVYVKGLNPGIFSLSKVEKIEWVEDGPLVKKQRITCSLEGANEVQYEITQFNNENRLFLSVIIDKKAIRDKESVHIAFPFSIDHPIVRIGVGDSFITPEQGQIPGSNKDFYSVQRWIDISNDNDGVTICSLQGALFEVGNMIDEQKVNQGHKLWKTENQSSATIFLYAMNNYWHTNYKADQDGKVRFDFVLQFHKAFDIKTAQRFGMEATQPLLAYPGN
jgi:alpha-mannosidase